MIGAIAQDSMSPAERMQALVQGRTPDRAPFSPFGIGFAARLAGIDRGEFYRSPETAFRCGLEVAKTYTWMNSRPTYGWADRGIWEFGGRIVWPDGNRYAAPLGEAPLISSPEQVDDLPDPDPATAGMNPLLDRFNRLARDNGFPASLPGGTPTAMASAIAGRQNFLRWMIRSPEAVHRLQAKVTSFIMRTAQRTMDRYGPENCGGMVAVPLESNQIMSEKMFARFCKPYIAQILDFYVSSGVKSLMVHLCGDHTFNLPHWKDLPLPPRTVYSVGHEMDLEETGPVHRAGEHSGRQPEQQRSADRDGRGSEKRGAPVPGGRHAPGGRLCADAGLRTAARHALGKHRRHCPGLGRIRVLSMILLRRKWN